MVERRRDRDQGPPPKGYESWLEWYVSPEFLRQYVERSAEISRNSSVFMVGVAGLRIITSALAGNSRNDKNTG